MGFLVFMAFMGGGGGSPIITPPSGRFILKRVSDNARCVFRAA